MMTGWEIKWHPESMPKDQTERFLQPHGPLWQHHETMPGGKEKGKFIKKIFENTETLEQLS